MTCSEAEQFFDAYLDGELASSLRLEFDAHRLRCPVCQQKLSMMEACEDLLSRDARVPPVSDDFTARVMNKIGERRLSLRRARRRRLMIGAAVALQAAAVFVIAVLWWGGDSSTGDSSVVAGANERFIEKIDQAIDEGDKVRLLDLMFNRGDQLAAARFNLTNDLGTLARYATNLSVLGDLPAASDDTMPSPWEVLMPVASPAAEETEPATGATGPFSL